MNKEQLSMVKVLDKIKLYEKTGKVVSTNFLDPAEQMEVQNLVNKVPNYFSGGYLEAERKILVIGSEDESIIEDFLQVITLEANRFLSHREVLGSILGLGLKREMIGDILIKENCADVIVQKEMAPYIFQNLNQVGREKVKVSYQTFADLLPIEIKAKEIKTTVASLRVDAIISSGIGVSREVSSKLIQNQRVKWNHKLLENPSKKMNLGDILSIRGYGRIELLSILGETKKDRIRVILKKY